MTEQQQFVPDANEAQSALEVVGRAVNLSLDSRSLEVEKRVPWSAQASGAVTYIKNFMQAVTNQANTHKQRADKLEKEVNALKKAQKDAEMAKATAEVKEAIGDKKKAPAKKARTKRTRR